MDVDPPAGGPSLKRSNSAPMINELPQGGPAASSALLLPRGGGARPRVGPARRFSGSFSPSRSPTAPLSPLVLSRVSQIKQEESMDVVFREAAHERETKSRLQMSHSLEDLTLEEPLRVHTPSSSHPSHAALGSPSPTGRQCFSPSTCQPVPHGASFAAAAATASPSPTRKSFTRCSQSPISLRPSQLSLKRKFDEDEAEGSEGDAKHLNTGAPRLSFAAMETTCHGGGSGGNGEAARSPYGTFKPVDPAPMNQKSFH